MNCKMSLCYLVLLCYCSNTLFSQNVDLFEKTDIFLRQVVIDGKVNYQKAIELEPDRVHLTSLIKYFPLKESDSNTQKAFWLNTYNLCVILYIVEYYPKWSVQAIPNFFELQKWEIADSLYSLDMMETILDGYEDPRVHFALVCGANDCPRLSPFAYKADILDKQLDHVTTNFINDLDKVVEYDSKLELNKVFEWNEQMLSEAQDLKSLINKYRFQKVGVQSAILFKKYDWSLNEYQKPRIEVENNQRYYYTKLYEQGQYEAHLFNNYYTANDAAQNPEDFDSRSNFYTIWGQFLYGFTNTLNVGFDVRYRSVNQNFRENTSGWDGFKFKNEGLARDSTGELFYSRSGFTGIGPKIKYQPHKKIPNVTLQHTLLFPMGKDLEGNAEQGFIDWNNLTFINQLFYDQDLGSNLSLFTEVGLIVESLSGSVFRRKSGVYQLSLPVNIIISYFMDDRSTLYGIMNATPRWYNRVDEDLLVSRNSDPYSQLGLGYKYFFSDNIQMEILYTFFSTNETGRTARTANFGIRYYHR